MKKYINIKMATALAVASIGLFCAGCDYGCMNGAKNRQAVVTKYSTEVWNLPGQKYKFIARKPDGSVWYVETMGGSENPVSDETQLFPAK